MSFEDVKNLIKLNISCFIKRLVLFVSLSFNFILFFSNVSYPMYKMLDVCYYFLAKELLTF